MQQQLKGILQGLPRSGRMKYSSKIEGSEWVSVCVKGGLPITLPIQDQENLLSKHHE